MAGKAPNPALRFAQFDRLVVAADGVRPGMKLQATATTAFSPAALAAASISLALLVLPSAAVPAHSSGVAPALKLVAGDVVAAVEASAHAIGKEHRATPVVSHATRTAVPATTPTRSISIAKRNAPAHHRQPAHTRTPRPHSVTRTPATTHSAPNATPTVTGAAAHTRVDSGHGKALGRPADVPHGPPAVPPGQAKKAPAPDEHAAARGHGGGE